MGAATTPRIAAVRRVRPARLLGDAALARAVTHGDQGAMAEMYRRHRSDLFRFCRSMLRDDEEAADALQTTMDRALRALPGEERPMQLRAWLFRVARNVCIDAVRARAPAAPFDAVLDLPSRSAVPEDAETAERLRELVRDLRTLPERQRSALVMRELVGLAHEEIAVALETSPAATKQAVYEARVALLELAEGRGAGCEDIRSALSDGDGRTRRGRRVRAHLRACGDCAAFDAAMGRRRHELAILAPPLAVPLALDGLAGTAAATAGGGGSAVAGGMVLPAAGVFKGLVIATASVAIGAGGYSAAGLGADGTAQPRMGPVHDGRTTAPLQTGAGSGAARPDRRAGRPADAGRRPARRTSGTPGRVRGPVAPAAPGSLAPDTSPLRRSPGDTAGAPPVGPRSPATDRRSASPAPRPAPSPADGRARRAPVAPSVPPQPADGAEIAPDLRGAPPLPPLTDEKANPLRGGGAKPGASPASEVAQLPKEQ